MVPRVNYYSGIIFKGYFNGIGSTVLRGGRYNNLLEDFGKKACAIGFSVDVNLLINYYDYDRKVIKKIITLDTKNYLEQLKEAIRITREGEYLEVLYKE